jgi:hypothetical protein
MRLVHFGEITVFAVDTRKSPLERDPKLAGELARLGSHRVIGDGGLGHHVVHVVIVRSIAVRGHRLGAIGLTVSLPRVSLSLTTNNLRRSAAPALPLANVENKLRGSPRDEDAAA